MITAQALCEQCRIPLEEKWGYIWGQAGGIWTEAKQAKATRSMTRKYGSRWIGKHVTDCSGLLSWAFKKLGGTMYHGANTIWNRWCTAQGTLDANTKLKPGTALFLFDGKKRHHVGLYVGNDTVIEAKGTCYGVVTSNVAHWDEWGELKGVDYTNAEGEAVAMVSQPTLRKGSRGDAVKRMQELLNQHGASLETDGIFGSGTLNAVKAFQTSKGLNADGVCGTQTWQALNENEQSQNPDGEQPQEPDSQPSADQSDKVNMISQALAHIEYAADLMKQAVHQSDATL